MTENELIKIINNGESSKVQFKERLSSLDSLAHELIAFSNTKGGIIIIGVNDEIARLLNESNSIFSEELLVKNSSTNDIDTEQFDKFLIRKYNKKLEDFQKELFSIDKLLENMNLSKNGSFLLAGLLCFSAKRQNYYPQYSIQCVSVDGTIISNSFIDNEYAFDGTISTVFQKAMDFIGRNMRKIPEITGFNSPTKWEIPYEVFEELLVNALVHRDYFISSTIKVYVYTDRVEIVSPGKLPNSLTVEAIKNGVSILRNPILLSTAQYILPYKGLGTGILRSYSLYKDIEIENNIELNQVVVTIRRMK